MKEFHSAMSVGYYRLMAQAKARQRMWHCWKNSSTTLGCQTRNFLFQEINVSSSLLLYFEPFSLLKQN